MAKVRVINHGDEQILLFPKEIRFRTKEVQILRRRGDIIIREKKAQKAKKNSRRMRKRG